MSYTVEYVPGTKQITADALSRAPVGTAEDKYSEKNGAVSPRLISWFYFVIASVRR